MLRGLIGKYCPDYPELARSKLYSEETFYKTFTADLNKCKEELLIESPFMTMRRISLLLPALQKLNNKGIKILNRTRNPEDMDNNMRMDSHRALGFLLSEGIHVVFVENIHRKIAIIDNKKLWEGSLNILSQNNSREVMRRTVSEKMAMQMNEFIGYFS